MARASKKSSPPQPSTAEVLATALELRFPTLGDNYWRAQVVLGSILPLAILLGEARARSFLALLDYPPDVAQGLGHLGEGLARAGQSDAARKALEEARGVIARDAVDGERGTLAWRAIALACDALGDPAACEEAIEAALACAARETQNPTQPWPHMALAFAWLGKIDRLIDYLDEQVGKDRASFAFADSIEIAIERLATRGDLDGLDRLIAARASLDGYNFANALPALAALKMVDTAVLTAFLLHFAPNPFYGRDTLVRSILPLALRGDVALARQFVADASKVLPGVLNSVARNLDAPPSAEALLHDGHPDACVQHAKLGVILDRGATMTALDEAIARAQTAAKGSPPTRSGITMLGNLAMTLAEIGEIERGAELAGQALTAALLLASHEKTGTLETLGLGYARFGLAEQAQIALRKLTAKYAKEKVGRELSKLLIQRGDFAGALAVLQKNIVNDLRFGFRLSDSLSQAAHVPENFVRHS